jgi:hypothetical protein
MVPTKLPKEDNASWEGNATYVVRLARVNASNFWLNQQVFRIQGHRLLVYKYVEGLGHCDPAPDHGEHGNHHPQGDDGRRAIFVSFVWCLSRSERFGLAVWTRKREERGCSQNTSARSCAPQSVEKKRREGVPLPVTFEHCRHAAELAR